MRRNTALLLIASGALIAPALFAATLVNINTADSAELQTLSGIGPSKAQAIIDYRTQNGPFETKEEIMNVSGIGTATYDGIKDFITVGSESGQTQTQTEVQTATGTTQPASPVSSVPAISAAISAGEAVVGAGTVFEGAAFGTQGEPLVGVRFLWNFGDGSVAEGMRVMHTYAYPGSYTVFLSAAYHYSSATARRVVEASPASVALYAEGDGSLTVGNRAAEDLDIGLWSLRLGSSTFVVPEDTLVIAGKGVRFSPAILGFTGTQSAALYYPNGARAATGAVSATSALRGQTVELPKNAAASIVKTAAPVQSEKQGPTVTAAPHAATVGLIPEPAALWAYLLALCAVIAAGAVGAYYARVPVRAAETDISADEFEIVN